MKHDYTSVIPAPYGPFWRKLRRITTIELFSITRLATHSDVRQDEIRSLIKTLLLEIVHDNFTRVGLRSRVQDMSFNIIMRIVSGKRSFDPEIHDLKEALNFHDMITGISKAPRVPFRTDLLPFLKWIDFQGMKRTLLRLKVKKEASSEDFLDKYWKKNGVSNKQMIDAMLSLQEAQHENYSDQIVKGILLVCYFALIHQLTLQINSSYFLWIFTLKRFVINFFYIYSQIKVSLMHACLEHSLFIYADTITCWYG